MTDKHFPNFVVLVRTFYKAGVSGEITSPNYPGSYGVMKDYYWRIATYRGRRIRLTMEVLDIESDSSCTRDFLKVYDGVSTNSALLKTYCGSTELSSVVSSRQYLYLHFRADASGSGRGFKLTWEAITEVATTTPRATTTTTAEPEGADFVNSFFWSYCLF